jgi:hypothetical protein
VGPRPTTRTRPHRPALPCTHHVGAETGLGIAALPDDRIAVTTGSDLMVLRIHPGRLTTAVVERS